MPQPGGIGALLLIKTDPLDEISQAEEDSVSGATVKPVILMP
jgi:hypothetical protein